MSVPDSAATRRADVPKQGSGADDDDLPLPVLPALPADPRWRVEHLPFLTTVSFAVLICAASVGYFVDGITAALGAAAGVAIVTVSFTMSTLVIAWADTVRPALLMPLGMLTYVVKYTLLGVIMVMVIDSGWPGRVAMGWGIVAGVLGWTAVQAWWVTRLMRRK
jgi:predicted tellurium resistance membrane protein TerC